MQLEKYKQRKQHNISESTMAVRLSGQRSLQRFIDGDREPTPEDVEEWLDHQIERIKRGETKASTVREYFKAIKYYFETVKGEKDSLDHIDWLPDNDSDPGEYMTKEEWQKFLSACQSARDKAYFALMYYYARRPSEVLLLNEEDINLQENTVRFNILKKKDKSLPVLKSSLGEMRVMRATFELIPEVRSYVDDLLYYKGDTTETVEYDGEELEVHPMFITRSGRQTHSSVWRNTKTIAARAGIEKNITPKSLRHTRATHLDWEGEEPGNIARDMLVHGAGTDVISRYIHDRDEDQVRTVMGSE